MADVYKSISKRPATDMTFRERLIAQAVTGAACTPQGQFADSMAQRALAIADAVVKRLAAEQGYYSSEEDKT